MSMSSMRIGLVNKVDVFKFTGRAIYNVADIHDLNFIAYKVSIK